MATNIEVIIGTYEQFTLGYKVEKHEDNYSLHQSFAVHAHTASVRTVHSKGKYLATGGADDRIYVYDMKRRQEIQLLTSHDGMVNHLRFTPEATHIFSASSDGTLAATRTGSWIAEGFWKAPHGGKSITHISIHPSGKLALTLGADLTLRTWNLIKGRQIFTTNLKSKSSLGSSIECVEFSPTGNFFILSGAKSVELWSVETANVVKEIPCECKPTSVCWLDEHNLLIGLNNGKTLWSDLKSDKPTPIDMNETRIKGLCYHNGYLASISSNGDVIVWTVSIEERKIEKLCQTNSDCRPICLTIIDLSLFADDYELKIEDDEKEANEAVQSKADTRSQTANQKTLGRVVIEDDNNDLEEERRLSTPKSSSGKKKKRQNSSLDTSQAKIKRQSGFIETDETPTSSPVQKAKTPKNRKVSARS